MNPRDDVSRALRSPLLRLALILTAAVVWALWPSFEEMSQRWTEDPTYSHGYIVPLFSIALLWLNRHKLAPAPLKSKSTPGGPDELPVIEVGHKSPTNPIRFNPWGLAILALAGLIQFAGAYFYIRWLNAVALLPYMAGIAVVLGGWPLLKATWTAIAFLVFMIPLPFRVESTLRTPLRNVAASAATFVMQMIGLPAVQEGTVIDVNDQKIGVAEACSGLAMLMTFVALAFAVALIVKRPWLDKLLILLSAVPIAILCNIIRITVTGICFATVGEKWANLIFHDIAGWLMMPMAVGFMAIELLILDRLLVDPTKSNNEPLTTPILIPGLERPPVRGVGRT
jgi:exosortase